MASAKEYEDYINKMRGLRAQRDAGLMTTSQAVAQAPQPAGVEPVNSQVGTMRQMGRNIAESFSGGVKQMGKDIGGNIATSARAFGRGVVAAPGVIWEGKNATGRGVVAAPGVIWEGKNATSSPSIPPYMAGTTAPAPAVRPTSSTPSEMAGPTNMTVGSGMVPKRFVLGNGPTNTIYSGALASTPTANKVFSPEEIRAIGDGTGLESQQAPKSAMTFGNTSAAQNARAAEEYRAFMARSQANADRFMERDNATRPRAGESQSERRSRVASEASAAADAEARKTATAENAAYRALERDKFMTAAKAQVEAAAAGKPDAKAQDAALLKEYVAAWSLATEDEKPALMEKIMALGGGANTTTKPVAKDKDGKEVFLRNGKYVYADGTEYKAA